MAINWFPGHMNKARNQIKEAMPDIDLVVEVLDARLPYSSTNPLVNDLRADKPCIKVLNKADIADPKITQQWIDYYNNQNNTHAIALVAEQRKQAQQLIKLIKEIAASKANNKQAVRVMIMGIPNVGKSTLINALAGRYIANTGNEPAVTKRQQMIDLKNGVILSDTPGILWPKFENQKAGYRLAFSGAIKDTAIEYEDVAASSLMYLQKEYWAELSARYKLKAEEESGMALLELIGRKRGCLRSGGIVDMHKAAEIVLHEFRSCKIGHITLEQPHMVAEEEAEVAAALAAKEAEKEERKRQAMKGKRQPQEEIQKSSKKK